MIFVDPSTGEAKPMYEPFEIVTQAQKALEKERRKCYALQKEKENFIKRKAKESGIFVWYIFDTAKEIFPQLKNADITRLIYLATYTGYGGFLEKQGKPIQIQQLGQIMKLSDKAVREFVRTLKMSKIIDEKNGKIYIDKQIFLRGSLNKTALEYRDKAIIRIYINAIRNLYESSDARGHKRLCYLYKLIPYVNQQFNVVCLNPQETSYEAIELVSLGEFAKMLGYDESNVSKLCKELFEIKFLKNGVKHRAISYLLLDSLSKNRYRIVVNPFLYYAGSFLGMSEAEFESNDS